MSALQCPSCATVIYLPRKRSKLRELEHIKTMYCYKCKEIRDLVEIRDLDKNIDYWENWHKEKEV